MIKYTFLLLCSLFIIHEANSQNEQIDLSVKYLSNNQMSPAQYIIAKFSTYDIVLLAEEHKVKENLVMVQELIPELYKNGVYNIGMEFGASEDQETLDSLVSAPEYNEDLARKLMFNYNTGWAFKEYMDIYKKAWLFNKTLSKYAKKFRIVNLSYRYHWASFSGQRTPENMKVVFYNGNTESYRFNIVNKEIISKNEKILILTGDIHAFTKYKHPVFDFLGMNFVRFENGYFGNLLYEEYPNHVFSILLHKPFRNYPNRQPQLVSPANGAIEKIMSLLGNKPVGFDLNHTPLGNLSDSSYYSMGYTNFTLGDFFDGYIFIKPFDKLSDCTIDTLFLNQENWKEALNNVADPDWRPRPKSLEEYWQQIIESTNIHKRYGQVNK